MEDISGGQVPVLWADLFIGWQLRRKSHKETCCSYGRRCPLRLLRATVFVGRFLLGKSDQKTRFGAVVPYLSEGRQHKGGKPVGVIKAIQNIFRERNEADVIASIVEENKRLRETQDYIDQTGVFGEHGEGLRKYQALEAAIIDVRNALVTYERAEGKISAEYTIYMLKKALERTRDNNL
jgi:uncharacterized protein (UPF0332 family)